MAWCVSAPAWRIRAIEASAADPAQNACWRRLSLEMRGSSVALMLLVLLAPARSPGQERLEPLGRWSDRPARCLRSWAGARLSPCTSVVLDQRTAGVMRLLLLAPAPAPVAYTQLGFVGQLQSGSEPMPCRQGLCRFSKPMVLSLSSVSQAEFDARGLALGLPSAWPVNGQCLLRPERIRCEARAFSGESWTAEAVGAEPMKRD